MFPVRLKMLSVGFKMLPTWLKMFPVWLKMLPVGFQMLSACLKWYLLGAKCFLFMSHLIMTNKHKRERCACAGPKHMFEWGPLPLNY